MNGNMTFDIVSCVIIRHIVLCIVDGVVEKTVSAIAYGIAIAAVLAIVAATLAVE